MVLDKERKETIVEKFKEHKGDKPQSKEQGTVDKLTESKIGDLDADQIKRRWTR